MTVKLHIERLVIDEALMCGKQRAAVLAEIEKALAQRLVSGDAIPSLRAIGSVAALPSQTLPQEMPMHRSLGARIAVGVGQALQVSGDTPSRSIANHGASHHAAGV